MQVVCTHGTKPGEFHIQHEATPVALIGINSAFFLLDFTFPVKEHVEIGEHLGLFDFR